MHETIAECMIFANSCVAEKISSSLPTCSLLRRHPPPLTDNLTTLVESASTKGWRLKVDSNKALSKSLDACVDPVDPDINKVVYWVIIHAKTNDKSAIVKVRFSISSTFIVILELIALTTPEICLESAHWYQDRDS